MSPEYLIPSALILLGAYFIRGITGFGSGLIAVPLLALFLPLKFVVPLMLVLDFTASVLIGGVNIHRIHKHEVWALIPFSVIGVTAGTNLLVSLPQKPMLIGLSIFVFVFALKSLLNLYSNKPISQLWAAPTALTGGTVGALFGTGGPPYVIYLTHRIHDKSDLRATLSAVFFMEGLTRIISFIIVGLLTTKEVWTAYFVALPIVFGALYLGGRVHLNISPSHMSRLIGGLLLISSLSLLARALF